VLLLPLSDPFSAFPQIIGDYTQHTTDQLANFVDTGVLARDIAPCQLRTLPSNTVAFVDFDKGYIGALNFNAPPASPSTTPRPPVARIAPGQDSWTAGSGATLKYTGSSNAEGREGLVYRWNVTLTTCTPGSSECTREAIPVSNGPNLAFTAPTTSGALEIDMHAGSYSGFGVEAPRLVQVALGAPACPCYPVSDPIPSDGSGGAGGGGGGGTVGSDSGSGVLSNPAALGGIIAAAAVVGIAVIAGGLYAAGVPQKLGLGRGHPNSRPTNVAASAAGSRAAAGAARPAGAASAAPAGATSAAPAAAARAAGAGAGAGAAASAAAVPTLAARRDAKGVPPLSEAAATVPRSSAPGATPANTTPVGDRKV
jgi:hypothetical protein